MGPQAAARPLFVSVGHRVGLVTAVALARMCCRCVAGPTLRLHCLCFNR